MLVICATSPITNLIRLGRLNILLKLFEKVIIPEAVYHELSVYENQKSELSDKDWIIVKPISDFSKVEGLLNVLDQGEAEAIILAKELVADLLIIDERKGRRIAEDYGLRIIGLMGVLYHGKKKGYIDHLKPILDELIYEIGFRVDQKLYHRILKESGEWQQGI